MHVALEQAILRALKSPPCVVAFSGGRDSSGVLALAVQVARREGTELPIPVTYRFPGVDEAEEASWQEEVIRCLELDYWERIAVDDELDMVGPIAASVMRRHGLLMPFNAFFLTLALQRARGGSLITGAFGDEVLSQDPWLVRRRMVLTGKVRPSGRDLVRAGVGALPRQLRAGLDVLRGYPAEQLPNWLTERSHAEAVRALADDRSRKPLTFENEVHWWWGRRYAQIGLHSLRILGADHDCEVVAPFLDPRFLSAFASAGKWMGFKDRTEVMHILFDGLLPPRTVERSTKATFNAVFWNTHTERFLSDWSGEGLDPSLVDVELLKEGWKNRPDDLADLDFRSACLLQSAWLAVNRA